MPRQAIYLTSLEGLAGKSTIAISLALLAKDLGIKVGYFKPIGVDSGSGTKEFVDEDAETLKHIVGLKEDSSLICPFILRRDTFLDELGKVESPKILETITKSYLKTSEGKDLMIIEGPPTLSEGSFINCSVPKLARDFKANIITVTIFKDDFIVDDILQAQDYLLKWEVSLSGVVINKFPPEKMDRAKRLIASILQEIGVDVLGVIPEDKMLSALTVKEIYEFIGGKVLAGKDGMNKTIQNVLIGAMTPESATRYFQKVKNELVITGGDRTDIIFAALEAGVSALVLTGNLYPSVKIFPKADELAVPIILVPYDTYTTLQQIQKIVGRIKPQDNKRVNHAKKLVKEHVEWRKILQGVN